MSEIPSVGVNFPEKMKFLFEPKRFKVAWGGRASGKSWSFARALVLLGAQRKLRILCVREYQNSIRESVHQVIEKQVEELQLKHFYTVQRDTIVGANGTEFVFLGMHLNPDKVRSYEDIDVAWVEEAANVSKASWRVLTPTIRKAPPGGPLGQGAEIWISMNPILEDDYTYKHFILDPPTDSIVVNVNYVDNPFFPQNLLQEMEDCKARDYDEFQHVWQGLPKQMLEGAVFADELREARAQKRITKVPYDKSLGVDAIFDLGRSDHTSIWFVQRVGWEQHYVNFYQSRLHHIDHYLTHMQSLGYVYDTVWLPHDAKAKRLGSKMTIEEQVRAKGFDVRIVPRVSIPDKINAGRTIFSTAWIDEANCADGLHSLRNYKYEVKNVGEGGRETFSQTPLHNWASDAADAWCYSGLAASAGRKRDSQGRRRENLRSLLTPSSWLPGGSTGWMGR